MKGTAIVLSAAVLLVSSTLLLSRRHHKDAARKSNEPSAQKPESTVPETTQVLPPVSDVWSRTAASNRVATSSNGDFVARPPWVEETPEQKLEISPAPKNRALKDPFARFALLSVGLDPMAEQYWVSAINDPTLSENERKDLIEDLNEEGFADPKNLTSEDLPLIVSRIALIEELAPEAMDQANADAFMEAYKDLLNMFASVVSPNE